MVDFYPLTVRHVRKTTADAVVVTLDPPNDQPFPFIQGQYLTFRKAFDGEEVRRSYSICSGVDDGVIEVGIKRVEDGLFSSWANTELQAGDTLEAMSPQGRFHVPLAPLDHRNYLAFAAGSGITPVLSLIRTSLALEPHARFTLVYANRTVSSIMFREELEDLKNQYMGRLSVIHILNQDAQGVELFKGRLDANKCDQLFDILIDLSAVDTAFICGPEPMMHAIAEALKHRGLTKDQIKYELFVSNPSGSRRPRQPKTNGAPDEEGPALSVSLDGTAHTVQMKSGETLLEAALRHEVAAPYSCRAGVCSTCICRLTDGRAEMIQNHALEDYEVERGYVLSCQAVPTSDFISIVYEDH